VEEAQSYIVVTTKELSNSGEITMRKDDEANEALIG
jgi:flagellar motor switch protein FliG